MVAGGQTDEDGRVVAPRRNDHQLGAVDVNGLQALVAGRICLEYGTAHRLGFLEPVVVRVDDHDAFRFGPQVDEFLHGSRVLRAEAGDDDVVAKSTLDSLHDEPFPGPAGNEGVGRAGEDEEEEDADRSDDDRVEQAGSVGDGDDVSVPRRRRADHREIDDIKEADRAVVHVLEPVALDPVDENQQPEQKRHGGQAPAQA